MKILVGMKLSDTAVGAHLWPISQAAGVDRILVVRNTPGPPLPKVEYHCPPGALARIDAVAAVYRLWLMARLSLSQKPDYVHSYLLFPHGVIAYIAARLTGRRVGTSLLAGPVELYVLGGHLNVDPEGRLPVLGRLLLHVLKSCAAVTVTGSVTKGFLVAHGVKEDRVFLLHHAVSAEQFRPMDIPRRYDIVSVGRLAAVKRVDVILRAAAAVRKTRPDLKVAIVGDGPCRGDLERLAGDLGMGASVDFLGQRTDVATWYNSGRVFVLTSEREGFPFALIEAMMCGTPCVTSDCGDIVDVVRNGENALLVQEHDDVDGFARAIDRLLGDEELRARLAGNAMATVRDMGTDRVTADWEAILPRAAGPGRQHQGERTGWPPVKP